MGLDKRGKTVFNGDMAIASKSLGLSRAHIIARGIYSLLFGGGKKSRVSPLSRERERFEEEAKDQFQKLKDKGLSIPVFTL
jgi:hypothetical protein